MAGEELCLCTQAFTLFGILTAAYIVIIQAWKAICGLRNHIVSRWCRTDLTQYGQWAVVTGATDGIGKAYALELAKRGLDVVLISRTLEKLKRVAAEIEKESGRKIKYIQADFTNGSDIYHRIQEELKGLEIGILVNNVGMKQSEVSCKFLDTPNLEKMLDCIINCNILSAVQMTRIILPQMLQRKKGLVINISSEAGNRPYPMAVMYSASKVFVDFFSRALCTEYKSQGITVQCVMPLFVSTDMTFKMKPNTLVKSAGAFACEALNTVGYTDRTSGCLTHSLQSYAISCLPDNLLNFLLTLESSKDYFENLNRSYKNKVN
ncbi:very-long-chain 3-oxoacyl-CoA reductase-like [Bufo gargarizans]|uniref:very-long-chain 3-oxoacyl-CoA reductase-like n=1 Tax=Bufo gargarizans TaxID=30331 RepID=UPI001CF38986|nr:very-long-chain 3-oxoacyl-CoA reductase-like [Bufo gargarizans]